MQKITLDGPDPVMIHDMLGETPPPKIAVEAELYLPEGPGPHPGVVVSEGLGGLQDKRERDYGRMLAEAGYAVLVVDSFGTRGYGDNGDFVRAMKVTEAMMLGDAFTALAALAARDDVDAGRIGIIGFSYGGMITQLAAYEQLARAYLGAHGPRFACHVSYYGCSIPRLNDPATPGAPVTILLGGLDRNVDIARAEAIGDDLRRGGSDVEVIRYDGIYHQWDGTDETRRWVPANLRYLHLRLDRDYGIHDERGRMKMRGRWSRRAVILRHADPRGYHILRDRETTKKTNDLLLARLQAM
ncbi:dienelactone hydrolase family protein [Oceanicola granulosus]|nr:dienelactone hydrolase family protein [Oceanicola granulosus]